MRLMLRCNGVPSLLVSVEKPDIDLNVFDFYVVNGNWNGAYTNGRITIKNCPGGDYSTLEEFDIMCISEERLQGHYQDVFSNIDNPDYAPTVLNKYSHDMDDDIPF